MREFDDLTKALATGTSRRQALRRLGGGLVGAAEHHSNGWLASPPEVAGR